MAMNQIKPVPWNSSTVKNIFAAVTIDDLLSSDYSSTKPNTTVKKDLLAVSCHLYRNFKNDIEKRYMDLTMASNTLNLTEQDFTDADTIADYYSKQIVIRQLKGDLTDFKKSVLAFLQNRMAYNKSNPGLIYRLPEYYAVDQTILKMKDQYLSDHKFIEIKDKKQILSLKPTVTVRKHTRERKIDQYWFIDTETNNPVMIDLHSKNEIKHIWDNMFETSSLIKVDATWISKRHSLNFDYVTTDDKWSVKFN